MKLNFKYGLILGLVTGVAIGYVFRHLFFWLFVAMAIGILIVASGTNMRGFSRRLRWSK